MKQQFHNSEAYFVGLGLNVTLKAKKTDKLHMILLIHVYALAQIRQVK